MPPHPQLVSWHLLLKGHWPPPPGGLVLPPLPFLPGIGDDYRVSLRDVDDPAARELAGCVPRGEFGFRGGCWVVETLAGGSGDLRSAETGAVRQELRPRPDEEVGQVFRRDGRGMAVFSYRKPADPGKGQPDPAVTVTVRYFDLDAGKEAWAEPLPARVTRIDPPPGGLELPATVLCEHPKADFSPDGRQLAVFLSTGGGALKGWVLDTGSGSVLRAVRAAAPAPAEPPDNYDHIGGLGSVAFGPGGRLLATYSRELVVWDGEKLDAQHRLTRYDWVAGEGVFTAAGRRLLTLSPPPIAGRVAGVRVWDLATGRQLLEIPVAGREGLLPPGVVPSSPPLWLDGDRLMLPVPDGVRVFDGTQRQE